MPLRCIATLVERLGPEAHCKPFLCTPSLEFHVTEERKFAILFAATLMCARKLMEIEDKPSPVRMSTLDKAIRNAAYILGEIDKKWPKT
jgi:hypothetical protein